MIMTSLAENGVSDVSFHNKRSLGRTPSLPVTWIKRPQTSASPELVLVCLDDLALQFEGLFWKQLKVSDVV